MKDEALELAIERQRNSIHPMYLARKFDDWTQNTGILSGWGLTWVLRLPIGIIMLIVSPIYWLVTNREKAKRESQTN